MCWKKDFAGVHHGLGGLPAGRHAFGFAETGVSAFAPVRRRRQGRIRAHRNLELTSPFLQGSCRFLATPRGHSSSNTFTRTGVGTPTESVWQLKLWCRKQGSFMQRRGVTQRESPAVGKEAAVCVGARKLAHPGLLQPLEPR